MTANGDDIPFPVRGLIEGFYGTYYTFPQRNDLIEFAGAHGFNFYLYGPKNDRQHRMRWWDPYPDAVLDEFAETIELARGSGVRFCYAISFGVPMNYASADDFAVVTNKLLEFYRRGCRDFGVLVDDTSFELSDEENRRNYPTVAHAHADVSNRILAWLSTLDEPSTLLLTPTEYWGRAPFTPYLETLGRELRPGIELLYTGPDICTPTIGKDDCEAFGAITGRQPIIWDNYPVNDLAMQHELHVGPLRGRDPELWQSTRGYLANLMNQPEASKIALLTIAEYVRDPKSYEPDAAWRRALREVAGEDSFEQLRAFAENSLESCLFPEEAPRLDMLVRQTMTDLRAGTRVRDSRAAEALGAYFSELDEAGYHLKNRMPNLALRQEIIPWIEALEETLWMGRGALTCLRAMDDGADYSAPLKFMDGLYLQVTNRWRKVGGREILSLADFVHERDGQINPEARPARKPSHVPVAAAEEGLRDATESASPLDTGSP